MTLSRQRSAGSGGGGLRSKTYWKASMEAAIGALQGAAALTTDRLLCCAPIGNRFSLRLVRLAVRCSTRVCLDFPCSKSLAPNAVHSKVSHSFCPQGLYAHSKFLENVWLIV